MDGITIYHLERHVARLVEAINKKDPSLEAEMTVFRSGKTGSDHRREVKSSYVELRTITGFVEFKAYGYAPQFKYEIGGLDKTWKEMKAEALKKLKINLDKPAKSKIVKCGKPVGDTATIEQKYLNKVVRRKGSKTQWKVWAVDEKSLSLMDWNTTKKMSRRVQLSTFEKSWEIVK